MSHWPKKENKTLKMEKKKLNVKETENIAAIALTWTNLLIFDNILIDTFSDLPYACVEFNNLQEF